MKWPIRFGPRKPSGAYDVLDDPHAEQTFYVLAARKRRDVGRDLQARLYLHDGRRLFVTAVAGIADVGPVAVLELEATDQEIGACVRDHLLRFSAEIPTDVRDRKASDWPAFKASKERSVKSFEARCLMAVVDGGAQAAAINAFPHQSLHQGLSVHAVAPYDEHSLGAAIRRTLDGARALREAGVV